MRKPCGLVGDVFRECYGYAMHRHCISTSLAVARKAYR
jgi:hypothetical protein